MVVLDVSFPFLYIGDALPPTPFIPAKQERFLTVDGCNLLSSIEAP